MTPQEAFDKSTRGIIAQGGPAMNEVSGTCAYQALNKRRCAIGQLLGEINPEWEGMPLGDVLNEANSDLDYKFARELQACHDFASRAKPEFFWRRWKEALKTLTRSYGLDPAVLKEIPE